MLIDRKEDTINVCEIKFAKDEFEITKEYEAKYGPLTSSASNADRWDWVSEKWPWHYDAQEDL